jgi:hypothetical protein
MSMCARWLCCGWLRERTTRVPEDDEEAEIRPLGSELTRGRVWMRRGNGSAIESHRSMKMLSGGTRRGANNSLERCNRGLLVIRALMVLKRSKGDCTEPARGSTCSRGLKNPLAVTLLGDCIQGPKICRAVEDVHPSNVYPQLKTDSTSNRLIHSSNSPSRSSP